MVGPEAEGQFKVLEPRSKNLVRFRDVRETDFGPWTV